MNASEDYDLHIYTYDGKHVGMNYTTGEYEIGIENATTGGNLPGGGPYPVVPTSRKVAALRASSYCWKCGGLP